MVPRGRRRLFSGCSGGVARGFAFLVLRTVIFDCKAVFIGKLHSIAKDHPDIIEK
jgi:hypothetical protein